MTSDKPEKDNDNGPEAKSRSNPSKIDITLPISLVALALSAAQLFFTSPLIYEQFIAPRIVVENIPGNGNQSGLAGFMVGNVGRSSAENVQLGVLAMEGDEFTILPELPGRVEANDSVHFVTYTIIIDQLHRGEQVTILLQPGELHETTELPRWQNMGEIAFILPSVTFLRHEGGQGEVLATKFDPQIRTKSQ